VPRLRFGLHIRGAEAQAREEGHEMSQQAPLSSRRCAPCEGKTEPLPRPRVESFLKEVPEWRLTPDNQRIRREWRVKGFLAGLDFFRRIAEVAEAEDHHPDLHLVAYRNVAVEIWTHAANGLTENDFILAAKIDLVPVELFTNPKR